MQAAHTVNGRNLLLGVIVGLLSSLTAFGAGDSDLFTASVAPNVMLMVDNSGSMEHIVWHPDFDATETPTCTEFSNDSNYRFSDFDNTSTECGNLCTIYPDPDLGDDTRISGRYLNWLFSDESASYQADIAF